MKHSHEYYMELALTEAQKAFEKKEIPVGAIIVYKDKVIGKGHNTKQSSHDVTSHAEINAIREASKFLKHWNLEGTLMYVTLEPCIMCSAAIIDSRIKTVYYGATEEKTGGHLSKAMIFDLPNQHKVDVYGGISSDKSKKLMKEFFKKRRP